MDFSLCSGLILACSLIYGSCSSGQGFALGLVCSPNPASFRFHLTTDTLAFGCILPTTGRIPDFHRLETCAAERTMKRGPPKRSSVCLLFPISDSIKIPQLICSWHADFVLSLLNFSGLHPGSSVLFTIPRRSWPAWCRFFPVSAHFVRFQAAFVRYLLILTGLKLILSGTCSF